MKSTLLAIAVLLIPASATMAQNAAPDTAPAPAVHAAKPVRKPAAIPAPAAAAAPVAKLPDTLDISQIVGIRQLDAATYEIDAKTQNGAPVSMRMNAFVMQDLGRQLGTFGH